MTIVRMSLVGAPPRGRRLLENHDADDDFVFTRGDGEVDLSCGDCGRILAARVAAKSQVTRLSRLCLACPTCAAYNVYGD